MIIKPESFVNLKRVVTDSDYVESNSLIVRKMKELFIIKYDKSKITLENQHTLGLFRSIICDASGKILCFAPPKSIDFDCFSQTTQYSDCYFQEFAEGTMINMFWDPTENDWNIATRSNIGGRCKFDMDKQETFRYMFLDACNHVGFEFDNLEKQYCYSLVLQHPKNRIVVPIVNPDIFMVKKYLCHDDNTVEEISFSDKDRDNFNIIRNIKPIGEKWQDMLEYLSSDNIDYIIQGIVMVDKNTGTRSKFRSKNYEKVKHLKGNSPKMQHHYYHLRQKRLVNDFLHYYPEYRQLFRDMRSNLHDYTNQLYKNYVDCFIKKTKPLREYPHNFKNHMYHLHEKYIDDLKPNNKYVTKYVVMTYVNNLPPPRLMYSVNYQFRKHDRDVKVADGFLN